MTEKKVEAVGPFDALISVLETFVREDGDEHQLEPALGDINLLFVRCQALAGRFPDEQRDWLRIHCNYGQWAALKYKDCADVNRRMRAVLGILKGQASSKQ